MKKIDVIIVLGFDVTQDGQLPDEGKSRAQAATELVLAGKCDKIVFSGDVSHLHDYKPRKSEAESMKDYAVSIGVKENDIIAESTSRNTYENAVYCKKIIDAHKWRSILVITSKFHVDRAGFLFKNVFGEKYNLEFQTCQNRLSSQELELITQMERIKSDELHNSQAHIVNPRGKQMRALLAEYLKLRTAS